MQIKILGPGCINCKTLHQRTQEAASQLNLNAQIDKVEDIREIMKYGISTPMLVVDEVVKHQGKPLPSVEKIKELLQS
jgi:small redox-active disulfide protein 2